MKKTLLLPVALLLFVCSAMAQQPTGALTIFSEDGDKFFLILNGERQNNVAQTNLRVEDLPQPYYNAKIIFENQSLPEISKNNLMIADYNNVLSDVTYKIKKDKNNGKVSMKYYSAIPMQQGFVAPPNVYVMHFGAPVAASTTVVAPATTGSVTQTTTTSGGNTGGAGINMNVDGVNLNMGISITDPTMTGTSTTQTTTTHTSSTTTSGGGAVVNRGAPTRTTTGCPSGIFMSSTDFSSALATIKKQSFDDTKLSTAKQIAGGNCLSANQVADVCKSFSFEESKLAFAKYAYERCTEPSNYFKVNNVFSFSTSVDELNEYIQTRQ